MGRPSKLTPELQERICEYIENESVPLQTACAAVGITPRTMQLWMAKGRKDEADWDGDELPPGTHLSFFRAVTRAEALAEITDIKRAREGDGQGVGNGRAKCAQWMLQHTRGQRYQPKIAIKVEQETAVWIDVAEVILPPEMFAELLAAMSEVDDEGIPRILSAPDESEADATTH